MIVRRPVVHDPERRDLRAMEPPGFVADHRVPRQLHGTEPAGLYVCILSYARRCR